MLCCFVEDVTQASTEAKTSDRLIAVAIVMLLVGVAIGVAVGWAMGQSRSQASQSVYVRVLVLNGTIATATLNNYTYDFFYHNYMGFPQPVTINLEGYPIVRTIQVIRGQSYDVLGIEVLVSEVNDDFVILLVKSL
jgi:hypothetical protein